MLLVPDNSFPALLAWDYARFYGRLLAEYLCFQESNPKELSVKQDNHIH